MNNKELLNKLLNDLQVCKPNKKEAINVIITMLSNVTKKIDTQYNLGCICEACIKSHFSSNEVVTSSPKGVHDLNIEISQYNALDGCTTMDIISYDLLINLLSIAIR